MDEPAPRPTRRLVSWSPVAPALMLPSLGADERGAATEIMPRVATARRAVPWLAGLSALTPASLILGLPVATARLGGVGFLVGGGVVLGLAIATAAAVAVALGRVACPRLRRGHGARTEPDLLAAADAVAIAAIVATVPARGGGARSYCPRCPATLRPEAGACPDRGVPLVPAGAAR